MIFCFFRATACRMTHAKRRCTSMANRRFRAAARFLAVVGICSGVFAWAGPDSRQPDADPSTHDELPLKAPSRAISPTSPQATSEARPSAKPVPLLVPAELEGEGRDASEAGDAGEVPAPPAP
jgi:hypothetical protein